MPKNLFIKRWFLQGIVITLPIVVTIVVFYYLTIYTDLILAFIWTLLPLNIPKPVFPGLGLIFVGSVVIFIGSLTESFLIRKGFELFNYLMSKLPVIRSIYTTVHQIVDSTIGNNQSFSSVVLIEYPRKGIYSLAFKTSEVTGSLSKLTNNQMVNVFLPTTPNPTSGFYLLVPKDQVIETTLTPEKAFKLIISAGIVQSEKLND